jgi:hypothetical protein
MFLFPYLNHVFFRKLPGFSATWKMLINGNNFVRNAHFCSLATRNQWQFFYCVVLICKTDICSVVSYINLSSAIMYLWLKQAYLQQYSLLVTKVHSKITISFYTNYQQNIPFFPLDWTLSSTLYTAPRWLHNLCTVHIYNAWNVWITFYVVNAHRNPNMDQWDDLWKGPLH